MRLVRWVVALGSLAAACDEDGGRIPAYAPIVAVAPPPAPVEPRVAAPPSAALVAAHAVIEESCGACHRSDLDTAVPEALAVFDLWDPEWLARLDDIQLASVMTRLEDQGALPQDLARVRAAIAEVQGRRMDPDCTQS